MITSHRQIQEGLIRYIKTVLDGYLSEMPTEIGSTPSVIKDRINAPRPDFPYVVVDRVNSTRGVSGDNSWCKRQYLDEENRIAYDFERRVSLLITCYGEDADSILSHLQYASMDAFNKSTLNDYTGATFTQFTDVTEEPLLLGTDFVDGATTEVQFTLIQTYKPQGRGEGYIKGVEAEGNVGEDQINIRVHEEDRVTRVTRVTKVPELPLVQNQITRSRMNVRSSTKTKTKLRRPKNV